MNAKPPHHVILDKDFTGIPKGSKLHPHPQWLTQHYLAALRSSVGLSADFEVCIGALETHLGSASQQISRFNYGLGHFEGNAKGSIHKSANDVNSTWGWDSKRNVFIPNFTTNLKSKTSSSPSVFAKDCYPYASTADSDCVTPFKINDDRAYGFNWDSMAGGAASWPTINRLTLYTPYTTTKIQNFFESKAVFDKTSSTGFRKWNPQTLQMDEVVMSLHDTWVVSANPIQANTGTSILYTQYLQTLFDKGADIVDLNMYDGAWRAEVTVPPASANAGKVLRLKHYATYGTTVTIDGLAMVFNNQTPQKISSPMAPNGRNLINL